MKRTMKLKGDFLERWIQASVRVGLAGFSLGSIVSLIAGLLAWHAGSPILGAILDALEFTVLFLLIIVLLAFIARD